MKTLPLILVILISSVCLSNAQNLEVPAVVKKNLATLYPKATDVKWKQEEKDTYEAEFDLAGTEHEVVFDKDGNWLTKEQEISTDQLPSAVLSSVTSRWEADEINEVSQITFPDGTTNFEIEVAGKELTYDGDGSLLQMDDNDADDKLDPNGNMIDD